MSSSLPTINHEEDNSSTTSTRVINTTNNINDNESSATTPPLFINTPTPTPTPIPTPTPTFMDNNISNKNELEEIDFELPSSATVLHSPFTKSTIILVGSVHIHQTSSDEVSDIIRKWKPDSVFIELCKSRAGLVLNSKPPNLKKTVDLHNSNNSILHHNNNQQFQQQQQQQQLQQQQYVSSPNTTNRLNSSPNIAQSHHHNLATTSTLNNHHFIKNNNTNSLNQNHLFTSKSTTTPFSIDSDPIMTFTTSTNNNILINSNGIDGNPITTSSDFDKCFFQLQDIDIEDMTEEDNEVYSNETIEEEEEEDDDDDGDDENETSSSTLSSSSSGSLKKENIEYVNSNDYLRYQDSDTDADDEYSNPSNSSLPFTNTSTPPTPVEDTEDEEGGASFKEMIQIIKSNGLPGLLHILMAEMIRKAGKQSNVGPGTEFITAYIEAKKVGASVVFGDRLVEITLQRVWNSLTRWEKIKFVLCLIMASFSDVTPEEIDALKNCNDEFVTQLLNEFKEKFPSVIQTIVTERDQYMAARLRICPGKKIVAVVGRGHVSGIIREWENYNINLQELESVIVIRRPPPPTPSPATSWLSKWASFIFIPIASVTLYYINKRFNIF
eukprot:gene4826-6014_t